MMTDKSVETFMNQEPRNIHKSVRCNRFYNGDNVVIIGDAAHPFRPIGQGINIALLDAMWLCQFIENKNSDIEQALSDFNNYSKL